MRYLGPWKDPTGIKLWAISLALLTTCFILDEPWKPGADQGGLSLGSEPVRIADSLYRSGEFANPFAALSTGLTAHSAPGFPVFALLLFKLAGEGGAGRVLLHCVAILALGAQLALLPWCARLLGYGTWTGVLAAFLGLLSKPLPYYLWEAHESGLLLLLLTAAFCYWSDRSRTFLVALWTGALAGLAIYFQPMIAPVYLGWILLSSGRQALRQPAVMALWLVPVLACLPWMVRNRLQVGTFNLRDDLGIEMNVSFNDCASYGALRSRQQHCFDRLHPFNNAVQAGQVTALGEYSYNRDRLRSSVVWIMGHPGRAAVLVASRFWFFWFPSDWGWSGYGQESAPMWLFYALTSASIGGLGLSLKRRIRSALILALLLGVFPLIYYFVLFTDRYRYPILWVTWLEAAYLCVFVWERAFASEKSALSGRTKGSQVGRRRDRRKLT